MLRFVRVKSSPCASTCTTWTCLCVSKYSRTPKLALATKTLGLASRVSMARRVAATSSKHKQNSPGPVAFFWTSPYESPARWADDADAAAGDAAPVPGGAAAATGAAGATAGAAGAAAGSAADAAAGGAEAATAGCAADMPCCAASCLRISETVCRSVVGPAGCCSDAIQHMLARKLGTSVHHSSCGMGKFVSATLSEKPLSSHHRSQDVMVRCALPGWS